MRKEPYGPCDPDGGRRNGHSWAEEGSVTWCGPLRSRRTGAHCVLGTWKAQSRRWGLVWVLPSVVLGPGQSSCKCLKVKFSCLTAQFFGYVKHRDLVNPSCLPSLLQLLPHEFPFPPASSPFLFSLLLLCFLPPLYLPLCFLSFLSAPSLASFFSLVTEEAEGIITMY